MTDGMVGFHSPSQFVNIQAHYGGAASLKVFLYGFDGVVNAMVCLYDTSLPYAVFSHLPLIDNIEKKFATSFLVVGSFSIFSFVA